MAKVKPFHSTFGVIHHLCSTCTKGNDIEYKKDGDGGLPLCDQCDDRIRNGKNGRFGEC